jgi:mannose/fructose/N-acetylgalactosamine-specific phosphotransferase system component IID
MQQYATKFADLLEQTALRVRAVTVDKVARFIKVGGLGILLATLGLTAVWFLLWAIFGALEIALTTAGAFAFVGVLFLGLGGFLWFTRSREK